VTSRTISGIVSPQPTQVSERDLVERCRAGDRAAWRTLYERFSPSVYRFICSLGVAPGDRDDACQEVFLAVYRSLRSFRGEALLSTWIYRIAVRGAKRIIQKRRLRMLLPSILGQEPVPEATVDPAEKSAGMIVLQDLLNKLDPKKRTVLVLFEIEGVPVPEIARIVGCPENTVWSRLHHARTELVSLARRRSS
jgi:RNA polymerase sigma-70 factor, ECF subfamily